MPKHTYSPALNLRKACVIHCYCKYAKGRSSYSLFGILVYCIILISFEPALAVVEAIPNNRECREGCSDYFRKEVDPEVNHIVGSVEYWHFGNKFWQLYTSRRWDDAIGELKFILGRVPNHPKALMLLSSIAQIIQNPALALNHFTRALKFYPQHAVTHALFGNFLIDIGQIDIGISELKEAIRIDPKFKYAYVKLAEAYAKENKLELSREAMDQAKKLGYTGTNKGAEE